jgi:aminoglycoside phosphotransferase (APT) family kinase protein
MARAPMWTADIEVDLALARPLIAEQFPALAEADVEFLGVGWDNVAFVVDRRIVFRFPRRRIAVPLIEREIAILPLIAQRVPLAISAPRYAGTASATYPWPFAGYDLIAGTTGCAIDLSNEQRAALAVPLGTFLRALHAIDPAPLVARGLPPDQIGRFDHAKRRRLLTERVPAVAASGAAPDLERLVAWHDSHPAREIAQDARTVVHGDFYARHVVLDELARPAGAIDWGDLHLGDPAIDLAIAHLMLPHAAHAAFRDAYGPIDAEAWSAARYRAIDHAILELDYGLRAGDDGMRRIGIIALELIAAAPPS